MKTKPIRRRFPCGLALCLAVAASAACAQKPPRSCTRMVLTGEVHAGKEWNGLIGEGWIFRVMPIQSSAYSGWDLVVDRDPPAGFPDALLLATPPYNSINEREVGTTFGLRAQDALGWNPRSFHFLVDPAALREGQRLFAEFNRATLAQSAGAGNRQAVSRELMTLQSHAAAGQFRILDARLAPGTADAASFAQNWAIASEQASHSDEPSSAGQSTPRGEIHWIKFSLTLWLPAPWKAPKGVEAVKAACE